MVYIWSHPNHPWRHVVNTDLSTHMPYAISYEGENGYYWKYNHNYWTNKTCWYFLCINLVNQKYKQTLWAIWTQGGFLKCGHSWHLTFGRCFSFSLSMAWYVNVIIILCATTEVAARRMNPNNKYIRRLSDAVWRLRDGSSTSISSLYPGHAI